MALHLVVSFLLIAVSVALVRRTRDLVPELVDARAAALTKVTFLLMWIAVWAGTMVTGSGPHAGDVHAVRTGFDGALVTQVHASVVCVTVALTVVCVALLRTRAAFALLGVEVLQAAIGILQYATGLPVWLVALHLLGAALAMALATNLMLSVGSRRRVPAGGPEPTGRGRSVGVGEDARGFIPSDTPRT